MLAGLIIKLSDSENYFEMCYKKYFYFNSFIQPQIYFHLKVV